MQTCVMSCGVVSDYQYVCAESGWVLKDADGDVISFAGSSDDDAVWLV